MFKRLLWLVIGASFGFGVSFWAVKKVRETMGRYTPEQVSANLSNALGQFGSDLRAAVAEGRQAMREREQELKAEFGDGGRR